MKQIITIFAIYLLFMLALLISAYGVSFVSEPISIYYYASILTFIPIIAIITVIYQYKASKKAK